MGVERPVEAVTTDFVECYTRHYGRLVRALRLSGAERSTAEEIAQEAFARSLVSWRRVSRGSNPPGYVFTTAFRLLRKQQRRSQWDLAPGSPAAPPGEATELRLDLETALDRMPPRRRACAVMCLLAGLSTHDAGEALGIADGTVRKHLEEARRELAGALDLDG